MRAQKVGALAQTVLFRRVRTLLIRAHGNGLIATTLNFDYEIRSAQDAFEGVPDIKIKAEMLDLAEHIIKTKRGKFDPATFDDRYEAALAELVKAKAEGRKIEAPKQPKRDRVIDLMAALRESAGMTEKRAATKPAAKSRPAETAATRSNAARPKATPPKATGAKAKSAAPQRKAS